MNKPDILHTALTLEEPLDIAWDTAVDAVRNGNVYNEIGLMRWGSNYTFLVNIEHEDAKFMGVYKPRQGERPLWDFPDGTLCQREAAAFTLSELLGWHLVPPTILREGERGIGSVQVFIDHDPQRHYFTFDETHEDQMKKVVLFDALANNADRKGGHCLLDIDNRIWCIDHGLTFNTMYKLRTVVWDYAGQQIPVALYADLQDLCTQLEDENNPLKQELDTLLSPTEHRALSNRLNRLLETGVYPMPGPGPNRPWPAV